jgi:hypothetical protein
VPNIKIVFDAFQLPIAVLSQPLAYRRRPAMPVGSKNEIPERAHRIGGRGRDARR